MSRNIFESVKEFFVGPDVSGHVQEYLNRLRNSNTGVYRQGADTFLRSPDGTIQQVQEDEHGGIRISDAQEGIFEEWRFDMTRKSPHEPWTYPD